MRINCDFIENIDEVMERLGGNELLLIRLLLKFRTTYINSRKNFSLLMEENNIEEAYRIVHSLKGVAANLGIDPVYLRASVLENKMKLKEYNSMQTEQQLLFDELETVLGQIKENNT